jgi:hypothetical protein
MKYVLIFYKSIFLDMYDLGHARTTVYQIAFVPAQKQYRTVHKQKHLCIHSL